MDLYRFFNADGDLLYVGISLSAATRAAQHRADKNWWNDVARMNVDHIEGDRLEAERIEREAIITERPLHNVAHNRNGAERCESKPRFVTSSGLTAGLLPVDAFQTYAFAMNNGTCPVGLVIQVWPPYLPKRADLADVVRQRFPQWDQDFEFKVRLYNWMLEMFTGNDVVYKWKNVRSILRADSHQEGKYTVYEMDPLADFQTSVTGRA